MIENGSCNCHRIETVQNRRLKERISYFSWFKMLILLARKNVTIIFLLGVYAFLENMSMYIMRLCTSWTVSYVMRSSETINSDPKHTHSSGQCLLHNLRPPEVNRVFLCPVLWNTNLLLFHISLSNPTVPFFPNLAVRQIKVF